MADLAPDLVAALQLGPDLVVPPDLVAQLPWEEDQATPTHEKETLLLPTFLNLFLSLFSL